MERKINDLCLIKKPVNHLDIGIVEKIHPTPPIVQLVTILENNLRCYECQLILIAELSDREKDIEKIIKERFDFSGFDLLGKIKLKEKFSDLEIDTIRRSFRDPDEKPIEIL